MEKLADNISRVIYYLNGTEYIPSGKSIVECEKYHKERVYDFHNYIKRIPFDELEDIETAMCVGRDMVDGNSWSQAEVFDMKYCRKHLLGDKEVSVDNIIEQRNSLLLKYFKKFADLVGIEYQISMWGYSKN